MAGQVPFTNAEAFILPDSGRFGRISRPAGMAQGDRDAAGRRPAPEGVSAGAGQRRRGVRCRPGSGAAGRLARGVAAAGSCPYAESPVWPPQAPPSGSIPPVHRMFTE